MYSVTTFVWKGGFPKTTVTRFVVDDDRPSIVIKSLEIEVIDGNEGRMNVAFALEDGRPLSSFPAAHAFVYHDVIPELGFVGYSATEVIHFRLDPQSGTPMTEAMMAKYIRLMELCGVYCFAAPRLITEHFVGNHRDRSHKKPVHSGQHLMDKLLQARATAVTTAT